MKCLDYTIIINNNIMNDNYDQYFWECAYMCQWVSARIMPPMNYVRNALFDVIWISRRIIVPPEHLTGFNHLTKYSMHPSITMYFILSFTPWIVYFSFNIVQYIIIIAFAKYSFLDRPVYIT